MKAIALAATTWLTLATVGDGLCAGDLTSGYLPADYLSQDGSPSDAPPGDDLAAPPTDAPGGGSCGCCGCCGPRWTVRADYVHLWREDPGDFPALRNLNGAPSFFASQFDFDPEPGVDASLVYEDCCGRGVELRYFWVDDFAADAVFSNPANDPQAPATDPPTTLVSRGLWLFHYASELQSVELLERRCCGMLNFSYGFRYVELDETLVYDPTVAIDDFFFASRNDLYGLQLGVDGLLWSNCCGLRVDGLAKAGVYYNDADASALIGVNAVSDRESRAAFVGELGLTARYDIRCDLALRAGYQLLFFDGVSLAADQVPATGNLGNFGTAIRVDSSSLLYHGLHVGLEYRR